VFNCFKYFIVSLVLCTCFWTIQANAVTITAASCSRGDVFTAINDASNGDTVAIPPGRCQWDSAIKLSKEIIVRGAGIDSTTIERRGFIVNNINNWRITGIAWDGEFHADRPFSITTAKNWRIDHIKFYDYASNIMQINGYSYGLIDNCKFTDVAGEIITIYGDGAAGWARSQDLTSTANADRFTNGTIYIEDCTFTQSTRSADNAVDSNNGARWVFRHNTVINNPGGGFENPTDLHGKCVTGWAYGTVATEVYKNTIIDNGGHWIQTGFNVRGGTGVIFNNEVPSTWNQLLKIYNERSTQLAIDGFSCKDKGPCASLGSCTTAADNLSAPYCDEQVNNFYVWGNTRGGVAYSTASVTGGGCVPEHVVAGRDFWTDGTEYPNYVEYPYPHPLRISPSAPPDLH